MKAQVCVALFVSLMTITVPARGESEVADETSSGNSLYDVSVSVPQVVNGKCQKTVSLTGDAISDEFPVDCSEETRVVNFNNTLLIGQVIFSDKPDTVVFVTNGRCVLKNYKEGAVTATHNLSRNVCNQYKIKMRETRLKEDAKNWGIWSDIVFGGSDWSERLNQWANEWRSSHVPNNGQ